MKTGISTASFFKRENTEDAIDIIKNLGAECAEVFYQTFYEYRPEFSRALKDKIQGIEINSVHVLSSNFEPQLFNPVRRVRGDGLYWLDQVMRSAQLLGCGKYTFHGGINIHGGAKDVNKLAANVGEVSAFCAKYGVKLCLENVSWSTYARPGIFRELKNRIPELCGVFDLKQARRSGYPYGMYIKDMEGAISHVHLSDVDANGKMCLPGKGIYNFTDIIRQLKDAGFDGNIILEVYSNDYGDTEELKTSLEYLNEIIYKLN